jgi:hypothetical protein
MTQQKQTQFKTEIKSQIDYSLKEQIDLYQKGLISSIELVNGIQWAAQQSNESADFAQVHFVKSDGINFVIQSGECFKIEVSVKIN